uniref:Uncharacterized protein n=2 Tax=Ursus TaxID=9639 RepID=A0A452V829_URSMA
MDWGKTLSSEQPRAADLAFLLLISRPTQIQAAEQRQRSPGAQLRPGHQVGEPDSGPGAKEGRPGPLQESGPGTAGRRRKSALSVDRDWVGTTCRPPRARRQRSVRD